MSVLGQRVWSRRPLGSLSTLQLPSNRHPIGRWWGDAEAAGDASAGDVTLELIPATSQTQRERTFPPWSVSGVAITQTDNVARTYAVFVSTETPSSGGAGTHFVLTALVSTAVGPPGSPLARQNIDSLANFTRWLARQVWVPEASVITLAGQGSVRVVGTNPGAGVTTTLRAWGWEYDPRYWRGSGA